MPKYIIHIGNRELEIESPSLTDAINTAMERYPGEFVSGWALMPEGGEETAQSPEKSSETPQEGDWGIDNES